MSQMKIRSRIVDSLPPVVRKSISGIRRQLLTWSRSFFPSDVITNRGIRIALDKEMGDGPLRALRNGSYEGGELAAIERYIQPDDIVLEMGTGIGFIALFCSKVVGPRNVHTFEANPNLETKIRKNFALNDMFPQLTIAALGDCDGEVEFHLQPEYWSSSRLQRSNSTQTIKVKQLSVNTVLEAIRPTIIVMDIEGGECELIPIMNLTGVQRVMVELHPYLTGEEAATSVENRLLSAGFVERWSCPSHLQVLFERV